MPSRSINDLHPLLAYAWGRAEAQWLQLYPTRPTPFLTATHRDGAEQNALFAQPTDKKDNDGDGQIDEADEFVTGAKAGQSPHNYEPALAFDIAFKDKKGKTVWIPSLFDDFARLVLQVSGITWGGTFKKLLDRPHFELTGWESLVRK